MRVPIRGAEQMRICESPSEYSNITYPEASRQGNTEGRYIYDTRRGLLSWSSVGFIPHARLAFLKSAAQRQTDKWQIVLDLNCKSL